MSILGKLTPIGALLAAGAGVRGAALDPADVDFFENKVRPLLVERCYGCHSARAESIKGGLRLDTREGVAKGGASGPVLIPGQPAGSLLIQAIHGSARDLEQMPPRKSGAPLSPAEVGVLEEWVRRGAPDPRTEAAAVVSAPRQHWAFTPPTAPPTPALKNPGWVRTGLDAFILARLEAAGLQPAPPADPRILLRRLTHDLTGLPPTPAEMEQFLADRSPMAYARAVDRLLASPRYGERWARHWLDVARYADSKGYVFEQERRFSHSFTYRDWVVQALNADLPYDRFLMAQIAGDFLVTPEDSTPLAALGFLTLGRRFLDNPHDIIDDRIDVVTRGTMGLTVQCARCHDHKYDPVPTADYYGLYGVFDSSFEPGEKPLLGPNPNPRLAAEYESEKARRSKELADFRAEKTAEVARKLREKVGEYLLCAWESLTLDPSKTEVLARERSLDPRLVAAWKSRLEQWKGSHHPAFAPWFALAALPAQEMAAVGPGLVVAQASPSDPAKPWNPLIWKSLHDSPPTNVQDLATRYARLINQADQAWKAAVDSAAQAGRPTPTSLPEPAEEELRRLVNADDSPVTEALRDVDRFFDTPTGQKSRALKRRLDELEATHPGAPLRAMALLDKPKPVEPVVFRRGNPGNRGPAVPRQFPSLGGAVKTEPFQQGSGRLELAQAIASRSNPLTARVLVNRVWLRYFGTPLVKTPSDFGVRSDPPSHPELLDYLAVFLMDQGWSLKALHREILLSAAYQQAADPGQDPEAQRRFRDQARIDPANQLYGRMNRKRLDFEALRDSLLVASGELDPSIGGQPVEIYNDTPALRRTLYGFIDRQNLPGVLRSFDFASPDSTSAMRYQTTVPQQALYLLNSPFAAERARRLAGRAHAPGESARSSVDRLYRAVFQREPSPEERRLALGFLRQSLQQPPAIPTSHAWSYGIGSFDEARRRTTRFEPFPVFKKDRWQPDESFPVKDDPRGYASLTAKGGHPGSDAAHAVIRRWTAPEKLRLRLEGRLEHPAINGDGVRARLVSSRQGLLATWEAHHGGCDTRLPELSVEPGETLDFIIEPKSGPDSDTFEWVPELAAVGNGTPKPGAGSVTQARSWQAQRDFRGLLRDPNPLDAWGRLAQTLLASNEFCFVD